MNTSRIKKVFEIKECNHTCPLHSRCSPDSEDCNFYDNEDEPYYAMRNKEKKPKYCKVKKVIVEEY